MIAVNKSCDVASDATRFGSIPDAASWADRQELARSAGESLASGEDAAGAAELLVRLASDDKWEVRLEVAQHLLDLPDADAARVAEQLVEDDNAYVRKAAQRAVDRRRRCSRAATAQQKDSERLARDLRRIVAEVGTPVTDRLLRFCQRQNEQFAAAVMHELRGIVTSLKSACQAVMAEATPSRKTARLREFLALLENTVNDMAAFTKPVPLERRRERLRDVIVEAVEVARENVRKCGLDPAAVLVQVDVSEAIVLPMARHLILMALANVIKNAHEAFATGQSPLRNGRITIRSEVRDRAIGIVIADNGFGMSGDDLAAIRDFRPGRRNKCKRYGTGYGLPIAARNLAAHDGTLAIESRENAGTTVVITLPLTCDDEENHHDHARTDRRRRSTHR